MREQESELQVKGPTARARPRQESDLQEKGPTARARSRVEAIKTLNATFLFYEHLACEIV